MSGPKPPTLVTGSARFQRRTPKNPNANPDQADSLLLPAASAAEGRGGAATMAMPEGTRDLDPNLDRDLDAVIAPPT